MHAMIVDKSTDWSIVGSDIGACDKERYTKYVMGHCKEDVLIKVVIS